MKKFLMMAVAVLLVSGAAFAGGEKKEKEGKTCGKSCHKEKKSEKPATEEKKG